jgi:hypothetical protein
MGTERHDNTGRRRFRVSPGAIAVATLILSATALGASEPAMLMARSVALQLFPTLMQPAEETAEESSREADVTDRVLDLHPDLAYSEYLTVGTSTASSPKISPDLVRSFRELLAVYEVRQAVDDNFTIRLTDERTGSLLEVVSLDTERRLYEQTGTADWDAIDRKRRQLTRSLIKQHERSGRKKSTIAARWGRRNQLDEAAVRGLPYLEHEIALARKLGLSLLATEIGTVETFNRDDLTSRAGARSRYQIMPDRLRRFGISRYRLAARSGAQIRVREERHPLLVMESAMILVRAYSNAVGHELPGLSAYHTGPYNIFRIYRKFLADPTQELSNETTVATAFVWGLTDGYRELRRTTSFRSYSRGYVPAVYGSLKTSRAAAVDTSRTLYAERIQLRKGQSIRLSDLLGVLSAEGDPLDWRVPGNHAYDRFRRLNPHIDLPARDTLTVAVPDRGDVLLVSSSAGHPVRIFLPVGSVMILNEAHPLLVDPGSVRRFDRASLEGSEDEFTALDHAYDKLIRDVEQFGFTAENRTKVRGIAAALARQYEESPTEFRRRQRDIADMHELVWRSVHFEKLAEVATAARGRLRMTVQPLENLPGVATGADHADPRSRNY